MASVNLVVEDESGTSSGTLVGESYSGCCYEPRKSRHVTLYLLLMVATC